MNFMMNACLQISEENAKLYGSYKSLNVPYRSLPERSDSIGNGTRTRSSRVWPNGGCSLGFLTSWISHTPFRFCHCCLLNCGLGYSGHTLLSDTCSPHIVGSSMLCFCIKHISNFRTLPLEKLIPVILWTSIFETWETKITAVSSIKCF